MEKVKIIPASEYEANDKTLRDLLDASEKIHDWICDCDVDADGFLHPTISADDFVTLRMAIEAAAKRTQQIFNQP